MSLCKACCKNHSEKHQQNSLKSLEAYSSYIFWASSSHAHHSSRFEAPIFIGSTHQTPTKSKPPWALDGTPNGFSTFLSSTNYIGANQEDIWQAQVHGLAKARKNSHMRNQSWTKLEVVWWKHDNRRPNYNDLCAQSRETRKLATHKKKLGWMLLPSNYNYLW